ncbi:subtilase-type protease inhibitor [Sphaerisporangium corydalis]|uniref:Subtilase-type protease inhibitor n=1 Tax=Sphaerisporangium corydalis TaxID=1441875 RepID=A0ABV9EMS6_9ACTN|nr:subtilase-type protease inhibitor [Sphaerisporangium corydalis]
MRRFTGRAALLGVIVFTLAAIGRPAVWAAPSGAAVAGSASESASGSAFASGSASAQEDWVLLAISKGTTTWPVDRVVLLRCSPVVGGTHPQASAACAVLRQVGGDLSRLRGPAGRACTFDYRPVTVSATGRWEGRPISFVSTYGNPCVMMRNLGVVAGF